MGAHEDVERLGGAFKRLIQIDRFIDQGLDASIIGLLEGWRHDEGGQKQRQ
jgi:hypothetical protein